MARPSSTYRPARRNEQFHRCRKRDPRRPEMKLAKAVAQTGKRAKVQILMSSLTYVAPKGYTNAKHPERNSVRG